MATPTAAQVISQLASSSLPLAVAEIEIRSALNPPVVIDVREALAPADPTKPPTPAQRALGLVKPTVILRGGSLGRNVLAPYGVPSENAWKLNLVLLAGASFLAGATFAVFFYGVGRRAGRRSSS
ncbi:MAG TPA: hypothetical protein VEA38_19225 [Terriglobales bacterium]|nr:hypothetical protein [Terriglobales bacterium]